MYFIYGTINLDSILWNKRLSWLLIDIDIRSFIRLSCLPKMSLYPKKNFFSILKNVQGKYEWTNWFSYQFRRWSRDKTYSIFMLKEYHSGLPVLANSVLGRYKIHPCLLHPISYWVIFFTLLSTRVYTTSVILSNETNGWSRHCNSPTVVESFINTIEPRNIKH